MDKRTQVELPSASADDSYAFSSPLKNWAGNLTYSTSKVHHPTTVEDVQAVIQQCAKLRVMGSRHSFNTIADSPANLVSLDALNKVVALDKTAHTITVESGMRYGDIASYLHENGYALFNLASLPHITIVGACATATHGSGIKNRSLASAVSAIEFVDGKGDVVTVSRSKNPEVFEGTVVNLGALGVVTKLTLDLLPTFQMKQAVYLDLPMADLQQHFETIQEQGYSVSLFTDWRNKNIGEVWIKSIVEESGNLSSPNELFGAKQASGNVHPISGQSAENVTEQLDIPGTWYERMPHFKMGFKPSAGAELQSEYFVPIENAYAAMMAIEKLQEEISPYLYISEIRTIAADDYWLSPFYRRSSVAFHFTWKQETAAVMNLLPLIEAQLAPFSPRPHWGKLFTLSPKHLQAQYARLGDFRQLMRQYDPAGKFRNAFLDAYLFS
jgi:xylitol oxidase